MKPTILLICLAMLSACASVSNSPTHQLNDGTYLYKQKGDKYTKAFVYSINDSIKVFTDADGKNEIDHNGFAPRFFVKPGFDLDVMTVVFKYRPGARNLPRQLLTDFNGNVFAGYRVDRFKVRHRQTPLGIKTIYSHRNFSLGVFGGLGSTAITPWTTNYLTTDEYNGFILSRGIAMLLGLNTVTVGAGVGWDSITDRDKDIWIYQNKPWYGLTVGLNIN
jgi:hypothetical protein